MGNVRPLRLPKCLNYIVLKYKKEYHEEDEDKERERERTVSSI